MLLSVKEGYIGSKTAWQRLRRRLPCDVILDIKDGVDRVDYLFSIYEKSIKMGGPEIYEFGMEKGT